MEKKLLVDTMMFQIPREAITEATQRPDNRFIVKGVVQRADALNQNGRIYPHEILTKEANKYKESYIKEHRAMGELDHPDSSVINLGNVSHNIIDLYWEGKDLMGVIEVLGTPAGNILKELFKSGISLGISSRGLGSVKKEGNENADYVQEDFELICWDFVSNPSTQGAFMKPLKEGVEQQGETCGKWCKVSYIISELLPELK